MLIKIVFIILFIIVTFGIPVLEVKLLMNATNRLNRNESSYDNIRHVENTKDKDIITIDLGK